MPKIKLEFNLPEERDDFKLAHAGRDFYHGCLNFDEYLREQLKYHSDELSDEQDLLMEKIRDKFNELISEETNLDDWRNFVQ